MTSLMMGDMERARYRVIVCFDNGHGGIFYCLSKPRVSYWEHTVNLRIEKGRTIVLSLFHVEYYDVEKLGRTPRKLAGLKTVPMMVIEMDHP